MALLTSDQILAKEDRVYETIPVPEWGGEVRLRSLTGKERDAFEASMVETNKKGQQKQNLANVRARLVSICCVNEKDELIFNSKDVDRLGGKSAAALNRIAEKCNEMNGLSDEDVEEMAEGFGDDPSESSSSD